MAGEAIVDVPVWVDLAAVTLGAISGGIVAIRCRFDISGVLALAIVTGLGAVSCAMSCCSAVRRSPSPRPGCCRPRSRPVR